MTKKECEDFSRLLNEKSMKLFNESVFCREHNFEIQSKIFHDQSRLIDSIRIDFEIKAGI